MSDPARLRNFARATLAVASLAFIGGGVVIVLGQRVIGDALMLGGGALLAVGAALLAWSHAPSGDGPSGGGHAG